MDKETALWMLGLAAMIMVPLVGWFLRRIVKQNDSQGEKLDDHGVKLVRIDATLHGANGEGGMVARVNSLHEWRNQEQARQLREAREELIEARERLRQQQPRQA